MSLRKGIGFCQQSEALSVDDAFSSVYNIEVEDFYGTKIKSF